MTDAVIVSAVRTAVGKAPKGTLRATRPDEMAATVIAEALSRATGIEPAEVEDVMLGCAMPEAEQGMNVARIASLRAGVPIEASAVTINRFCSSGLQAIAFAAERIMIGAAETIVAGGTESMSLIPMGGHKIAPNPRLMQDYPDVYLSTGLVAENHAREAQVSREEQDAFALRSHQRAVAAIAANPVAAPLLLPWLRRSTDAFASMHSYTFASIVAAALPPAGVGRVTETVSFAEEFIRPRKIDGPLDMALQWLAVRDSFVSRNGGDESARS